VLSPRSMSFDLQTGQTWGLGESYRVGRRAHSERGWNPWADRASTPRELRERAVRLVFDHAHEHSSQWAAMRSVAEKLGCPVEVLRRWVRQAERDAGTRPGLTTNEREELKRLQRENVELKRANEILRKASAFFAQAELDRRAK
jgi:transposase